MEFDTKLRMAYFASRNQSYYSCRYCVSGRWWLFFPYECHLAMSNVPRFLRKSREKENDSCAKNWNICNLFTLLAQVLARIPYFLSSLTLTFGPLAELNKFFAVLTASVVTTYVAQLSCVRVDPTPSLEFKRCFKVCSVANKRRTLCSA